MAIFQDESELQRQDTRVQFQGMKGGKKALAGLLGYDAAGGRTTWGKALNAVTPLVDVAVPGLGTGLSIAGRIGAKQLSRGTDANTVMDETDDEFISKTAGDVGTALALSGGIGSLAGASSGFTTGISALKGMASSSASNASQERMAKRMAGVDPWAAAGGSDVQNNFASLTAESKLANTEDSIKAAVEGIDVDALTAADFDEALQDEELEDISGLVDSVESKNAKEKAENIKTTKKATKDLTGILGEGGKMIEAGTKSLALNKSYADAADDEVFRLLLS